ncbi:MAG: hypothetical protein KF796_10190 [Ramlibacter sp.]|nr:hypothetical protein [Ramlibacter sp.]
MNTDTGMNADEEYRLPCAEALLASTLALMTGFAQGCCDPRRERMAAKVVSQLAQLAGHPVLSAEFRTMLWNLRGHWQAQLDQAQALSAGEQDRRLWHVSPSSLN